MNMNGNNFIALLHSREPVGGRCWSSRNSIATVHELPAVVNLVRA